MKAITIHANPNPPLADQTSKNKYIARLEEIPTPFPASIPQGHILIHMKAVALNHRDIYILDDQYPGITEGSILGADGAGVVICPEHQKGRRVLILPIVGWDAQEACPEDITEYGMLGMLPQQGTFSEYMTIEEKYVMDAPAHLSFTQLAAIPLAGLTAYRAVVTLGKVQPGSNVLIPGIGGGVATWLLQFAVSMGANVYMTSSSPEKISQALALGAKAGFLYTSSSWLNDLQSSAGWFDVVLDGASGPNIKSYIRLLKPGGRLVIYGAVAGSNVSLNAPYLWFKHITILGASMGSAKEFREMVKYIDEKKMESIVARTFSGLESFDQAISFLRSGTQMGKVVISLEAQSVL